jgi:hypothetical protein
VAQPDPSRLDDLPPSLHNNRADLHEHKVRLLCLSLSLLMLLRLLRKRRRMLFLLLAFTPLEMLYEVLG